MVCKAKLFCIQYVICVKGSVVYSVRSYTGKYSTKNITKLTINTLVDKVK